MYTFVNNKYTYMYMYIYTTVISVHAISIVTLYTESRSRLQPWTQSTSSIILLLSLLYIDPLV